jgi:simple sugar transport system ATP-binding protein
MNILYGLYSSNYGEIYLYGNKTQINDPKDAIKKGIGMVHQHFMLIPVFTVAENIVLGSEPKKIGIKFDKEKAIQQVKELSKNYGLYVDPTALIQDLPVGIQQRVEILKTLYRGAEILILDEPTAVLTPQEINELINIMRELSNQGKTIILITHKLKEIMKASDIVTVIRRGKHIKTIPTKETNEEELASLMVGRKVSFKVSKKNIKTGKTILKVENLSALDNRDLPALKNVSFDIKAGEILGIAGVSGNGQTELVEVLTGLRNSSEGKVVLHDKDITNLSPRKIIDSKLGHIPEDRQNRGLIMDFSMGENIPLEKYKEEPYSNGLFLDYKSIMEKARNIAIEFDVRPINVEALAKSFSGGNQQKIILGREISQQPEVLIASQPTRGLDVGAIEFVHKKLIEQRDSGKAILLISMELDEIMNVSDRIAVMYEGEIIGILDVKEATEEKLGLMMAGAHIKQ